VFTFTKNKLEYVGAVWFIAKLDGYSQAELGIYAETLFYYLKDQFSKKYEPSPENCLVVDVLNLNEVTYQMVLANKIPAILKETLKSIKAIL
jgi:hypothetical protein